LELIFLGTGAGLPARERNVTSIALRLLTGQGEVWLFDCGEATQHQMMRSPVKLSKINHLFVTHAHGDHIFGIPGMLGSRSFQAATLPMTLCAPKAVCDFVEGALSASQTHLTYKFKTVETREGIVYEDDRWVVIAAKLDHSVDSYGYRVIERDQPGKFNPNGLEELGIPLGPLYGLLKQGQSIQLEDGRVIRGEKFVGPTTPGRIIAIMGDTRYCKAAIELARGADVLVHEATFAHEDRLLAQRYYHSTATQAACVADSAGVSQLILTHISARYQHDRGEQLVEEAKKRFPATTIAHDGMVWPIDRPSAQRH